MSRAHASLKTPLHSVDHGLKSSSDRNARHSSGSEDTSVPETPVACPPPPPLPLAVVGLDPSSGEDCTRAQPGSEGTKNRSTQVPPSRSQVQRAMDVMRRTQYLAQRSYYRKDWFRVEQHCTTALANPSLAESERLSLLALRSRCHRDLGHYDEALQDADTLYQQEMEAFAKQQHRERTIALQRGSGHVRGFASPRRQVSRRGSRGAWTSLYPKEPLRPPYRGLLEHARTLYHRGNFEDALVLFHRGIVLRPDVVAFQQGVSATSAVVEAIGQQLDTGRGSKRTFKVEELDAALRRPEHNDSSSTDESQAQDPLKDDRMKKRIAVGEQNNPHEGAKSVSLQRADQRRMQLTFPRAGHWKPLQENALEAAYLEALLHDPNFRRCLIRREVKDTPQPVLFESPSGDPLEHEGHPEHKSTTATEREKKEAPVRTRLHVSRTEDEHNMAAVAAVNPHPPHTHTHTHPPRCASVRTPRVEYVWTAREDLAEEEAVYDDKVVTLVKTLKFLKTRNSFWQRQEETALPTKGRVLHPTTPAGPRQRKRSALEANTARTGPVHPKTAAPSLRCTVPVRGTMKRQMSGVNGSECRLVGQVESDTIEGTVLAPVLDSAKNTGEAEVASSDEAEADRRGLNHSYQTDHSTLQCNRMELRHDGHYISHEECVEGKLHTGKWIAANRCRARHCEDSVLVQQGLSSHGTGCASRRMMSWWLQGGQCHPERLPHRKRIDRGCATSRARSLHVASRLAPPTHAQPISCTVCHGKRRTPVGMTAVEEGTAGLEPPPLVADPDLEDMHPLSGEILNTIHNKVLAGDLHDALKVAQSTIVEIRARTTSLKSENSIESKVRDESHARDAHLLCILLRLVGYLHERLRDFLRARRTFVEGYRVAQAAMSHAFLQIPRRFVTDFLKDIARVNVHITDLPVFTSP